VNIIVIGKGKKEKKKRTRKKKKENRLLPEKRPSPPPRHFQKSTRRSILTGKQIHFPVLLIIVDKLPRHNKKNRHRFPMSTVGKIKKRIRQVTAAYHLRRQAII